MTQQFMGFPFYTSNILMIYFQDIPIYLMKIYCMYGLTIYVHKKSGFVDAGQLLRHLEG
jgi:hypothetical protein